MGHFPTCCTFEAFLTLGLMSDINRSTWLRHFAGHRLLAYRLTSNCWKIMKMQAMMSWGRYLRCRMVL